MQIETAAIFINGVEHIEGVPKLGIKEKRNLVFNRVGSKR